MNAVVGAHVRPPPGFEGVDDGVEVAEHGAVHLDQALVAASLGSGDQFEGLLPLRVMLGQELAGREEHRAGQTGVRCALLWPDPNQRTRLVEIRDNLKARIAEAQREGWLGEVEGLQVSLAGAQDKLVQVERCCRTTTDIAATELGIPTLTTDP